VALLIGGLAGCGGGQDDEAARALAEQEGTPTAEQVSDPSIESAAAPDPPEPRRILIQVTYDEPIELTLAGGECHVLGLELEADRYVEVVVEQRGVDLFTELKAPGADETILFDAPIGTSGAELVSYVTGLGGPYHLEICPFEFRAATRYELSVASPRTATARDRLLSGAFRRFSMGERSLEERDSTAARSHFAEALRLFQEAEERGPQAWVHSRLGEVSERRGDLDGAAAEYESAARIYRELGRDRDESFALSFLGPALSARHRKDEAHEAYSRSLELAERASDREVLATALKNLALLHEKLGDTLQALEFHDRRRTLAGEMGDEQAEWDALDRIGTIYLEAGNDSRARPVFEKALVLARAHDFEKGIRESLQNLGRVHLEREEAREALPYLQEALDRKSASEPDEELATLLNNLGRCYRRLGDRERAIELYRRARVALPADRSQGNTRQLEGMILVNLASLHIFEGNFEAAAEPSERAVEVYRAAGSPILITGALKCLADVRAAQGNLHEAASLLAEVVKTLETRRGRSALRELRATLIEDKYHYFQSYVEVLLRLHEQHPGEGYAASAFEIAERAKARVLLDELAGTESDILAAADPEVVARKEDLERQMAELEDDLLTARPGAMGEDELRAIRAQLRDLEAAHALAVARIFADYPGWSALLQSEPVTLEAVQRELLADGETQLVSFVLGDERSFAWIVGRSSIEVEALPGRERIERLARRAAGLLEESGHPHLELQARLTAEALSRELFTPLTPHLRSRKLLLVKDGALHYVPFGALTVPAAPEARRAGEAHLIDRFELAELPSASAAVALRRRPAPAASGAEELAVLGDPVFEAEDERLRELSPHAVPRKASAGLRGGDLSRNTRGLGLGELRRLEGTLEEAQRISALVAPDRRLLALGFDANRDLLLGGRLGRYRFLHLAGHGLAHPDLTGLVLSLYDAQGRRVDGLIRPYELYGTELAAELVVLSACSTGLGEEVRGEGLLGLSRGFLYAGASQVVASLWDVDDRATAELMERFYAAMLRDGDPPARALRKAQLSIRSEPRWAAPHYWAGFVLQGDGR
jgi:CHAT domain-containing protein/tetratricopeptide (TPR) repeat protein